MDLLGFLMLFGVIQRTHFEYETTSKFHIFILDPTADVYLFVRSKCTQESKNLRVDNMNSKILKFFLLKCLT